MTGGKKKRKNQRKIEKSFFGDLSVFSSRHLLRAGVCVLDRSGIESRTRWGAQLIAVQPRRPWLSHEIAQQPPRSEIDQRTLPVARFLVLLLGSSNMT